MKLTKIMIDDFLIVEVDGIVDSNATGPLCDTLVEAVGDGWKKLIVNLAGVPYATHAGVRGLIVAARLLRTGRGEMRVCGANAATGKMLRGLGFHHLLKCDPTVEYSILALSGSVIWTRPTMRAA